MRYLLLFVVSLFCAISASAQEDLTDTTPRHEVGVDVTSFIRQFLSWGDSSDGN